MTTFALTEAMCIWKPAEFDIDLISTTLAKEKQQTLQVEHPQRVLVVRTSHCTCPLTLTWEFPNLLYSRWSNFLQLQTADKPDKRHRCPNKRVFQIVETPPLPPCYGITYVICTYEVNLSITYSEISLLDLISFIRYGISIFSADFRHFKNQIQLFGNGDSSLLLRNTAISVVTRTGLLIAES